LRTFNGRGSATQENWLFTQLTVSGSSRNRFALFCLI